jgi:signal transduction histidine kinase
VTSSTGDGAAHEPHHGHAVPSGEDEEAALASASFDDLLREVLGRVHGVLDEQERLRLLLDAVVAIAADLSLDGVLARIVEVASSLVGAQYAALGVLGNGGPERLQTFVHRGMERAQVEKIGDLPVGKGLLGLIIDRPEPLRLHDIAAHPASYGFPENHPPMRSFLGVPVRIRDRVFGNLYLTEKIGGGDFTDQDVAIVGALAAAAGVAIENARLYEEAAVRERWLAATAEIIGLLAARTGGHEALQVVADRAREVSGADVTWIMTGDADSLAPEVVSGEGIDVHALPAHVAVGALARQVVRTGVPLTADRLTDPAGNAGGGAAPGVPELGPGIIVPLRGSELVDGVLALAWTPGHHEPFHALDPQLPAAFAEQAALALQVSRARSDQERLAVLEDRDRIGRDLHDLVIQRLFATGLTLQGTARMVDRPEVSDRLERTVDELDATIRDIRRSIFALGTGDAAADVQTEVSRLVHRAASTLKFRPGLRLVGPVRSRVTPEVAPHLLAVLAETLSNAGRHAHATKVDVELDVSDLVRLTVTDDGRGLPDEVTESGLRNLRERAERLGGRCEVRSERDHGTTVVWEVPVG